MPGIAYGYARVSSKDQNLDRQLDALSAFPIGKSNVYVDKASGKDFDRPMYKRLMKTMRPRGRSRGQEHRPTRAQLRRDHRGVAKRHQAHGLRDSGVRHAPARHPRDQGEHNGLFMSYFSLTEPLIP